MKRFVSFLSILIFAALTHGNANATESLTVSNGSVEDFKNLKSLIKEGFSETEICTDPSQNNPGSGSTTKPAPPDGSRKPVNH